MNTIRVVQSRKSRSSGAVIEVIDNRSQEFMDDDLRWYTLCRDHSNLVGHETRKLAEAWASQPEGWCNEGDNHCRATTAAAR